ncbi:hypothetical protein VSU19_15905 [Verrucomicrobiales bacterium BCK34]|nr:hypothetical protein [Verrucomicrobiales bacterium BCK34]
MEATEPSMHALAGYGFIFGVASVLIGIFLWKVSGGGGYGVGAIVLPRFFTGAIVFSILTAVVWWVTRS